MESLIIQIHPKLIISNTAEKYREYLDCLDPI